MIRSWWMFLIRVVLNIDLDLLLSLYHWTGAAQVLSQSSAVGSSWRCSGEPRAKDSWAGPHNLYPANLGQIRGVVQGFVQGCSWAEDESSEAEANFTMLSLLSSWQHNHFTMVLWLESNLRQGLCQGKCLFFRDVVERRMSHLWISPCFWDWGLSYLSLCLLLEGIEQYC